MVFGQCYVTAFSFGIYWPEILSFLFEDVRNIAMAELTMTAVSKPISKLLGNYIQVIF